MSYILLRSGLGSPTDIAAVREATGFIAFFVLIYPVLWCVLFLGF